MRRFLRYLLRGLILLLVFMLSALTAMRFAIHGRQSKVPKVVGMTVSQAERTLASKGLSLERGDRFFSSEVARGRIMSQSPQPNEQVRRGWRVRVAESMGPQSVTIPDLTGNSERAAEINIRRRGLEFGSVAIAEIPGAEPNQIVAQSPPANATNVSAPKISILEAQIEEPKSFVMPLLVGQSEDAAVNTIVNAGLKVAGINTSANAASPAAPNAVPAGSRIVVRTYPAAGQRIFEGQGVRLDVTR